MDILEPTTKETVKPPAPPKPDKIATKTPIRHNQVATVMLYSQPIVSLVIDGQERLCLAQISNTLLKDYSYNEIHNRRVALGITCVQCTPVQLEILRRAGAMPISSRRCGMITSREAERLVKSFMEETKPPRLPEDFAFNVIHACGWGCEGFFVPSRYNSSRAKCVKCAFCNIFFSPNKFIFHYHQAPTAKYHHPDAANFNSWRRHLHLKKPVITQVENAWEDIKAMFNGGSRKRLASPIKTKIAGGGKRLRVDNHPMMGPIPHPFYAGWEPRMGAPRLPGFLPRHPLLDMWDPRSFCSPAFDMRFLMNATMPPIATRPPKVSTSHEEPRERKDFSIESMLEDTRKTPKTTGKLSFAVDSLMDKSEGTDSESEEAGSDQSGKESDSDQMVAEDLTEAEKD